VVLANSAAGRDARSPLRNHLLNEQPVSLVGRPRPDGRLFRFPDDLRTEPVLLPSLDSDIRVAFDRVLELARIRTIILAEVDDMAMLRLLAREREGVTLVPPSWCVTNWKPGCWSSTARIPEVTESFYAIVQQRRFPNQLLGELLRDADKGS
jgi:LysR family transcriptional activator of nhaA